MRYYCGTASFPAIFWSFNSEELPNECSLVRSPSTTDDECHYDIIELSNHRARTFFLRYSIFNFKICENDNDRVLEISDLKVNIEN